MTIRALTYPRISSAKQTQGESIDNQEKACIKRAQEDGFTKSEIKTYREVGSGRNENRPVFEKMLNYAKETSSIEKIYIWDIDRFTRAGVEHYLNIKKELAEIGVELIDVAGVIQARKNILEGTGGDLGEDFEYEWSKFSPSEGAEIQKAQEAKNEARKILSRTIIPQIKNVQDGYEARDSIYGFRNVKIFIEETGKKKTTREIIPEEATLVREMYELTARGISPEKICEKINKKGFKTRTYNKRDRNSAMIVGIGGGNPLTPRRMWSFIEKVAYAGFKQEKWSRNHLVKAKHPSIVSLKLWNEANKAKQEIQESSLSPTGWVLNDLREGKKRVYIQDRP